MKLNTNITQLKKEIESLKKSKGDPNLLQKYEKSVGDNKCL